MRVMKPSLRLRWDISPTQAIKRQRELAARVIEQDQLGEVQLVAGVDVGFEGEDDHIARAAIVVLNFPELVPIDYEIARAPVTFPYISGLLAFREIPVILRALKKLKTQPDVFIVDAHGRAHPRRFGSASHLGVVLDLPTIGCAKTILCGRADEPRNEVGAWTPLIDHGEQIGVALRMRKDTRPIYVSIGHRVSLERAIDIVLKCGKGYRLPETTRYAHRVASGWKIETA